MLRIEADPKHEAVFEKTHGKCYMCGKQLSFWNRKEGERGAWEVGHKIARAKGGSDSMRNLVALCWSCNRKAGTLGVEYYIRHHMQARGVVDNIKVLLFGAKDIRRKHRN
jgi:5-methylcytosine-specific restriction endonuclease McrA